MKKDIILNTSESNFLDIIKKGELADIKSFGNLTLSENAIRVEKAITKMQKIDRVFGKSQTDFQIKTLNIGMEVTPERSISRISAELQRKKMALEEAKHNIMLTQIDIDELESKIENETNEFDKQRNLVNISNKKHQLANGMLYVEGAMKSILSLENQYDSIIKKCENFNEVDLEEMEIKSQIKKSLRQALEDIRETNGTIRKGEQQFLTGLGLNISKINNELNLYLKKEEQMEGFSNTEMDKFLNFFTSELVPYVKESIEYRGFNSEFDKSIAYLPNYNLGEDNG